MALNIVLVEPEIPQNTGNIIRTCACTNSNLHLIRPLGFSLDEKHLKRSGLDYSDLVNLKVYDNFEEFEKANLGTYYLFTTKTNRLYTDAVYEDNCYLIFGKETKGLSPEIKDKYKEGLIRLPMVNSERARSLNLSNAVAISTFEALRQIKPPELV